jgi:rod shape-determining protein MreD
MVRFVRLGLLLVLLVVLQTSLMPHLRIAGVVPDLGLVAAVALAARYGPETGAGFGFAAGLATDLFSQTPLGLAALAFGLTAFAVGVLQSAFARPVWWLAPVLAALAGVVAGLLYVGIGRVIGQDQLWAAHSVRTILLAAVYDGIVALVVFPLAIAVGRPDPRAISLRSGSGY